MSLEWGPTETYCTAPGYPGATAKQKSYAPMLLWCASGGSFQMVPTAKRVLSFEQIDAQTAVELPDRDMMALVNILIFDVVDLRNVVVAVPIGVAANVCGVQANVLASGNFQSPVNCTAATTLDLPIAFRPN
jgi:hypothetical protein